MMVSGRENRGRIKAESRALSFMQWKQALPLLILLLCREAVVVAAQTQTTNLTDPVNIQKDYVFTTDSGDDVPFHLSFTGTAAYYEGVAELTFPSGVDPHSLTKFEVSYKCASCDPTSMTLPFRLDKIDGQTATWVQNFRDPAAPEPTRRLLWVGIVIAVAILLLLFPTTTGDDEVRVNDKPIKPPPPPSGPPGHSGDPKFNGFDGSVFWFHGKKDSSWCIISDKELHVNAYFIGKSAAEASADPSSFEGPRTKQPHDLTWVQKLVFLFGQHTLIVSAVQESGWTKALDHLSVTLDSENVILPAFHRNHLPEAVPWTSPPHVVPKVTLTRSNVKNQMVVEVEGLVQSYIKVIPTKKGTWTPSSSFAHIDACYNLLRPTPAIDGVLGRTAFSKTGAKPAPYILWHLEDYSTTDLASPNCKTSQFEGAISSEAVDGDETALESDGDLEEKPIRISCTDAAGDHGMACR